MEHLTGVFFWIYRPDRYYKFLW